MAAEAIHRFALGERRFAIDPETCFCFECDEASWDVLEYYPHTPVNRILHELEDRYSRQELEEVIGELEWLRATKSILPARKREELAKSFEKDRGLHSMTVAIPTGATYAGGKVARDALALLFGRSHDKEHVRVEFVTPAQGVTLERITDACEAGAKLAALSGKTLTVAVRITDPPVNRLPASLEGHALAFALELRQGEDAVAALTPFLNARPDRLDRWAKRIRDHEGVTGRVVMTPGHPEVKPAVESLASAGFSSVELDTDGALAGHPELGYDRLVHGLSETAQWYAERLLKNEPFRLDPIATLFWRIYNGTPIKRADPSGTHALYVAANGDVYPSRLLTGPEFRVGNVEEGRIDDDRLTGFDDMGVMTTPACIHCWARHLCGGGPAAVHHALTGSVRTPLPAWCDAQCTWLSLCVGAFNTLSSQGVDFNRVYNVLDGRKKPSLFAMAKAAFRMSIGMRPLAEADAPLLRKWENWNRSAYFLLNERGVLVGNQYEREMDALHPRRAEHEMLLLKRDGTPFGLFKTRPDRYPGIADVYLYFHDDEDYTDAGVRRGFSAILDEAAGQQALRRLMAYATPWETGLQSFLEAAGFRREGTLREAVYTRGTHHPVHVYVYDFGGGS